MSLASTDAKGKDDRRRKGLRSARCWEALWSALRRHRSCRYIDLMLGINAAELAVLLAVVVAMTTALYFIVRLAVRHGSKQS